MGTSNTGQHVDLMKWKEMFGHLADQIADDTDADIKRILQDLPKSFPDMNISDRIPSDTVYNDKHKFETFQSGYPSVHDIDKLQLSNANLKMELESAMNRLRSQSEANEILNGRIAELEDHRKSFDKCVEERALRIREEIQAELQKQFEDRISSLYHLVQYLCEFNPKSPDPDFNTLFCSTLSSQIVSIFETSSKKLRTCPELVQRSATENTVIRTDSVICIPILENGDTVRNVLYIEGNWSSSPFDSARLVADVLRLRLINLNLKDMATANSERCEALLNMITIVGNIESERARNPSILCWAQNQLQTVLKCQLCRIWLVSEDSSTDLVSFNGNSDVEQRKPLGLGILSLVHLSKQPVLHNDALIHHPKFSANIDVPDNFNYRNCSSLLCVPVVDTGPDSELGDLHGVVQFLGRNDGQQFTNADLEIAKIFCRRLCSALRRERRVQNRFEEIEKDLLNASYDRDRYQSHLTGCEIISNLFNRDQGELYPSNFSAKVTGALRDALNAELVAIASVMPGHLLPYRLERVDKISHSPAFKRLAKQAIDSRSVVIRDNIHVSKVSYPLLVACTPLLDNLGRVIAVVFAGTQTNKFANYFSVALSIFATFCGSFLDRKHNLLKFSATMRYHAIDDEPAVSNSKDSKALVAMDNRSRPTNIRANSSIVLSDDEFKFSRSSSITNDDVIDATAVETFPSELQSEISTLSQAPVSAWRDWLSNELGSDTEQDESPASAVRSTRAEARIKSFALLHAESMSNLFDNMSSKIPDSNIIIDNNRHAQPPPPQQQQQQQQQQQNSTSASINSSLKSQPSLSLKTKPSSPSPKRPSIPHLSLSAKGRDIEEVNEVMAALIFENDDSADTIEFTGGEIEYIHPKTDSESIEPEVIPPPRSRRHERIVSSIDMKNVNLQTIFGPSENISDIAEETLSHISQESDGSHPERSSPISVIDQGPFRAPSRSSSISSHRSSRANSRRHTRKKIFQSESDNGGSSEPITSRSSASKPGPATCDDPIMSLTNLSSDEILHLKSENENMMRVMNILCTRTDFINPVDEIAAIRSIVEGALIALSVIVTQSDMLQIRIGKYWYRWQSDNENISDPSFVSFYSMSPADISEELNAADNPSWKGNLCACIANGKEFSRAELWGVKAVACRLNQILAYHCKFTELLQKGQTEYREMTRLQNQLQISNALIDCARTLTLSRGLHQIFGPDTCTLTKLMGAESAQLWLLDQTCTYLWTVFSESGLSNSNLKTIRCPIDQVCLLTQVAVSRMSAIYYEEDTLAAYNEEYDGIISTQKPGLRPRSLLMSAIGSDREGVLGVIRVCNKVDPTSTGNRARFTSSDQKFLETFCDIALDTVRSFRNSQKLQDRLEPAIKLAQTERQSRQRMQVLLSAQVSRLSKISKQALRLGEVLTLATRLLDRFWQIADSNASMSASESLLQAGFAFWKSLNAIDQFFIFVSDNFVADTNLPSLSSVSSLGNELSEIIEHSLSSKEITESRIPQSDLLKMIQIICSAKAEQIESNEERWVCLIPIHDVKEECIALCLCSKPVGSEQITNEQNLAIDHDQAQLFISILRFHLYHLARIRCLNRQIHTQNEEIRSLNHHLTLSNSSLFSFNRLIRLTCDILRGSFSSWDAFLQQIRQLVPSDGIRIIPEHEIDERIVALSPVDEHIQISLDSVFGPNPPPNLIDKSDEKLMKFMWRSCCISNQYLVIFCSTEFSAAQIEYYDYASRSAVGAYLLVQDHDQQCQRMKICLGEMQELRKSEKGLNQIMSMMVLFQSDHFLKTISWNHTFQGRNIGVDMNEALEKMMKTMAEILEFDLGVFIDLCPNDGTLLWRQHRIHDLDLYEYLRSLSGVICSDQISDNVFSMIFNGLYTLHIIGNLDKHPVSYYVLIPIPLHDTQRILILLSTAPLNPTSIHSAHEQVLRTLAQFTSYITTLNQDHYEQTQLVLCLQKQNEDFERNRSEIQAQLDHCLTLIEASTRDYWPMLSALQLSAHQSSPGLDMVLEDIFQYMGISYDHMSMMIATGCWAHQTTFNDLTAGLHPDLITQAEHALHNQALTTATASSINTEYRQKSSSGQISSIAAMWIPISNGIFIQILRRGSSFHDLDLISARLYANIANNLIIRRMLWDQVQQADVSVAKMKRGIVESGLCHSAMKQLLKEVLDYKACLFDLSSEQLIGLQSILEQVMNADIVTIYIVYQSDILRYAANEKTFQQRHLDSTHNIISWVLSSKSSYNVINSDTDPRYNSLYDGPTNHQQSTDQNPSSNSHSILFVPMNESDSNPRHTVALLQLVRYGIDRPFLPEHCQTADIICSLLVNILSGHNSAPASDLNHNESDSNRSLELQLLLRCGLWRLDRSDVFIQIGRDVISMLHGKFGFGGAALFLLNDADQKYHLQYTDMVLNDTGSDDVKFGLRQGLLGATAASASIQILSFANLDERFEKFPDQWMSDILQSTIIQPIIDPGLCLVSGLLQIVNIKTDRQEQTYTDLAQYLSSISALISVILQSHRLIQKSEQEYGQKLESAQLVLSLSKQQEQNYLSHVVVLDQILEFTAAVNGCVRLAPIFQSVQTLIKKCFQADRAHLFLYDSEKRDLFTNIYDQADTYRCLRLNCQKSVVGIAQRLSRPILLNRPWTESGLSSYDTDQLLDSLQSQSWYTTLKSISEIIAAPVYDQELRVIAVVEVCRSDMIEKTEKWASDQLNIIPLICRHISLSLQNCKQFHQLRRQYMKSLERDHRSASKSRSIHIDADGGESITFLDSENAFRLQNELQQLNTDKQRLQSELSNLYATLTDRNEAIEASQKRIQSLEQNLRYTQTQFRQVLLRPIDNIQDHQQKFLRDLHELQEELNHARNDNLQLINAMQSLISEYAADGNERIRQAICRARQVLSSQHHTNM